MTPALNYYFTMYIVGVLLAIPSIVIFNSILETRGWGTFSDEAFFNTRYSLFLSVWSWIMVIVLSVAIGVTFLAVGLTKLDDMID